MADNDSQQQASIVSPVVTAPPPSTTTTTSFFFLSAPYLRLRAGQRKRETEGRKKNIIFDSCEEMWPTVVHVRDVRADDAIGYMRSRGAEAFTRRVCCRVGFIPSRDEEEEKGELLCRRRSVAPASSSSVEIAAACVRRQPRSQTLLLMSARPHAHFLHSQQQ